ncbi:hypothetical protein [Variovorax sp. PvP013]|uniref:hypothetical protein n=1 Tax=Variovorax sp. PvP013 TaxID=3156435 RepID=UPI003D25E594
MTRTRTAPVRRDWIAKTLAGALLGLGFALGASGVFTQLGAGLPLAVRGQIAMWLVTPLWLGLWGTVYFFQSGARAWSWLALANLLVHGAWLWLRAGSS